MSIETKGQLETATDSLETKQSQGETIETKVDEATQSENEGMVKYATHKKLLNQLKNRSEELDELRAFKTKVEEQDAIKRGEFEKIIASRDETIKELQTKLDTIERDVTDGTKLQAFLDSVPGKVKKQEYLSFVDLDKIGVDPDTGKIDQISLERSVKNFVETYPEFIQPSSGKSLPNVGNLSQKVNTKRSLKELSDEELKRNYISGNFSQ